ncbi:hypothetical protein PIB30_092097, partial [Stylosanthes scabra]|nr:hypothetical protein [Stylosanthes scabra]
MLMHQEPKDEEEEEDPEEASASLTLPSPPKGPNSAYDEPHYWDSDGDHDQWGTDVVPMCSVVNRLLPKPRIPLKDQRGAAHPHPPQQSKYRTSYPHSTK